MNEFVLLTISSFGAAALGYVTSLLCRNSKRAFAIAPFLSCAGVWISCWYSFDYAAPPYSGGGASMWPVIAFMFSALAIICSLGGVALRMRDAKMP